MLECAFNKTCVYSALNPQVRARVIFELNFQNFCVLIFRGGGGYVVTLGLFFVRNFLKFKFLETVKMTMRSILILKRLFLKCKILLIRF